MGDRSHRLHHLATAHRTLLSPARRRAERARRASDTNAAAGISPEATFAYGRYLEAAGWLSLGADLRYFPRSETFRLLDEESRALRALGDGLPIPRVSSGPRTGWIGRGRPVRELEYRFGAGEAGLHPSFQTILFLARVSEHPRPAERLVAAMLFEDAADWDRRLDRFLATIRRPSQSGDEIWDHLAGHEGWLLDGLLELFSDLRSVLTWAQSARDITPAASPASTATLPELLAQQFRDEERRQRQPRVLVSEAARIQAWRSPVDGETSRLRLPALLTAAVEALEVLRSSRRVAETFESDGPLPEPAAWSEGLERSWASVGAEWKELVQAAD